MAIKVCHMTTAHKNSDVRIFHKECVSLAKNGYDVRLVAEGKSETRQGVQIVGMGDAPSSRLRRMTSFAKKLFAAALEQDCDIYHIHDPELLPFAMKLHRRGKKVIYDSHEKYSEQLRDKPYLPAFITRTIAYLYEKYENYVLARIDGLIFPCLRKGRHPFEGKCRNLATVDNYPLLGELYDRYDPSAEKTERSVCYVGSLSHDRGITHLIKACSAANCTLLLGGTFDSQEYEQRLRAMPEFACVQYLGRLDRESVLQVMQRSQVGAAVLHNKGQYNQYDNLSTKIYEYMSLALPVVFTASEYNLSVVEQYRFGVCVDPESVDEIAAALDAMLSDTDTAREMGENGRRAVAERFNWGSEEKHLLDLYDRVLQG